MSRNLADRLRTARHELFVGRRVALDLFRSALASSPAATSPGAASPFCLLFVHGPGGIGKTSLLNEFAVSEADDDVVMVRLDAHEMEATPEGFNAALREVLGLKAGDDLTATLDATGHRYVFLIDTFELLEPLEEWLRDVFLPQLPDRSLIVLAGRHAPDASWRGDSGWSTLMRALPLRNLDHDESGLYLEQRAVPAEQHGAIIDFTHGHPLALSLVADLFAHQPDFRFRPDATPDVVKELLDRLVRSVPGPAHRAALEACSVVHFTTESLLAAIVEKTPDPERPDVQRPDVQRPDVQRPDVHEIFQWLRSLSFIETGPRGIFPHDLVREALAADLRWHDPDRYNEIHECARAYYDRRLQQTSGQEQEHVLFDYIHLHRNNSLVRPFFEWEEWSDLSVGPAREDEWPVLRAMVRQHEGDASACLADYWFARQPHSVLVVHDQAGEAIGFFVMLTLFEANAEDLQQDAAMRAMWNYLDTNAPLREGECTTFCRFWMALDSYQDVSPVQSLIFVNIVQHVLTASCLAHTFLPCADAAFWAPAMAYTDAHRLLEADFEIGGRHFGVYGRDWRTVPAATWMDLMAARSTSEAGEGLEFAASTSVAVLKRPEFAEGVHQALRDLKRPGGLHNNVLLQSRMVSEKALRDASAPEAALRGLLQEAGDMLRSSPRQEKYYRALHHTYFHPAASQEQAAEMLDLPFSTYRRHLRNGIQQIAELLWQRELGH